MGSDGNSQGRPPPRLGQGRYVVSGLLGEGGTASVYLAWDAEAQQWRALKALLHKFLRDEEMRARFEQEAVTLAKLDHPNILRVFDYYLESMPPFMVMGLARGGSVIDWVREHGPMPPPMAVDIILQVCEGLTASHAMGVVHRDVKPHNFLLEETGVCKICDFGIARVGPEGSMTVTGSQIGTLSFMAPEQRSDTKSVDVRADVYSTGASLFTLLSAKTSAELFVADKDDSLLAGLPGPVADVIFKATQYDPRDRYQSIRELQDAIYGTLAHLPFSDEPVPDLVPKLEALPREPPATLPFGVRFEDLERSQALDMDQPTYVPGAKRLSEIEIELFEEDDTGPVVQRTPAKVEEREAEPLVPPKKVLPYTMSRATKAAGRAHNLGPTSDGPMVIGAEGLRSPGARNTEEEARERQDRVRAALEARRDATSTTQSQGLARALDDPRTGLALRLAFAVLVAVLALLAIATTWGGLQVREARLATDQARVAFMAAVDADSSVAYELGGNREQFERLYYAYVDQRGPTRTEAALAFAAALEGQLAQRTGGGSTAEHRARAILSAREAFLSAERVWSETATGFPGQLAVALGLSSTPRVR